MRRFASLCAFAVVFGSASLGVAARTVDLGDLQIPLLTENPQEARAVQKPEEARIEVAPNLGVKTVKAASTQDAVNSAIRDILSAFKPKANAQGAGAASQNQGGASTGSGSSGSPPPQSTGTPPTTGSNPSAPEPRMNPTDRNVRLIETGSGYGIVGVGVAYYDTKRTNPNLVLEDQRRAFMEADLEARGEVAKFMNELSLSAQQEVGKKLDVANTDTFSGANLETSAGENIQAVVNAMVTGLVTFDFSDDPSRGEVKVSVVSTPKTRGEVRQCGSSVVLASDLDQAIQSVVAQVQLGVVPPEGARIVTVPATGATAYVGYGSDVVQIHDNARVQNEIREAAYRTSQLRAQKSLVALLGGQRVKSESAFESRFTELDAQFDKIIDEAGQIVIRGKPVGTATTIHDKVQSDKTATAVNGNVPTGTQYFNFEGKGSARWVHTVAIYIENLPAMMQAGPPPAQPQTPPQDRPPVTPTQPSPPPAQPAADPCGAAQPEEGVLRLRKIGTGRMKEEALQRALHDAVREAYSTQVNADLVLKKKLDDAISDVDGKVTQLLNVNTELGEQVSTVTRGLIKGFRYLYDGPRRFGSAAQTQGDNYEVELCVEIPRFDPKMPRRGMRSTIAFLGLDAGRPTFEVGGDSVPAKDPIREFGNEVITYLTAEKRFTVIDREYLKGWKGEIDFTKENFAAGNMSVDEMRNVGNMLSADYVLVGTLQEVSFKQWDEYIAIRKRNEPRALLNINVHLRMIQVSTGEIVFNQGFNKTWMLPEIQNLLRSYGNMDRSLMATKEAANALLPQLLAEIAQTSADQARVSVLSMSGGQVMLANDDRSIRVGDELEVIRVEKVSQNGKAYDIETPIARLGVLRVQGDVVYTRILMGREVDIQVGMPCRRVQ